MKRAHAGQTRLGWMYVAIGLAGVVVGLEITMVYSALATFYKSFADPAHVVWIITTHFLFYASSAALCGGLGDIFGRKWVLLIVLAVVSMASLTSAFAPSLAVLILGRGLQGVSGAVLPLCFGIIRELVPKEKMSMPIGIASTVPSVTGALGLVLGGVIVDHFSWRAIFCVSSGVTILALAAVAACVPSTARREHSGALDILGGVLFVPAVGGILLSISQSKSWGWADHRTLALLGGGIAIMLAWIRHELRQSNPLIDVRLFCNRQIALTNACMALVAVGALQYSQVLLLILQQPSWTGVGMGLSGTLMGLVMLPKVLFDLSCGPWTGYMVSSRGARHAAIVGVMLVCGAWTGLTLFHANLWFLMAMMYLQSLGIGVLYAAAPNLIVQAAPANRTSEATGAMAVTRAIAQGVGSQMVGVLMTTWTIADAAKAPGMFPTDQAYTLTFAAIAAASFLSLAAVLMLPKTASAALSPGAAGSKP